MKKRIIATVLSLGMVMTLFTGCGKDEEKETNANGKLKELAKYEALEVTKSAVAITDDEIEAQIAEAAAAFATTENITKGKVKDKDVLNINYSGTVVGEKEPFEGGTAEGASLTIGSKSFIDDFEEQLIGVKIGASKSIEVTFPTEYTKNPDLAGKDAIFEVTVNHKVKTNTPKMTDEFVKENYGYSKAETVGEFKEYVKDRLYYSKVLNAVWKDYIESCEVEEYNEDALKEKKKRLSENYEAMLYNNYGANLETYLGAMGQTEDDWNKMIATDAESTLKEQMIIEAISEELEYKVSDDEYKEQAGIYATQNSYDSVEALESAYGKTEVNYSIIYNKVTEYIVSKAVVVEDPVVEDTTTPVAKDNEDESKKDDSK